MHGLLNVKLTQVSPSWLLDINFAFIVQQFVQVIFVSFSRQSALVSTFFFLPLPFDSISLVLNDLNSIIVHYIDFVLSHSIRESKILAFDKFHSI